MASSLRAYVVDALSSDLRGCEVLVESSGGPHSLERRVEGKQKKDLFEPDAVIDPLVRQAIGKYQRAFIAAHRRNWWHRTLCWLGYKEALRREAQVSETRAEAVAFAGQSSVHKMALERIVRFNRRMAKRDGLLSILTESNHLP